MVDSGGTSGESLLGGLTLEQAIEPAFWRALCPDMSIWEEEDALPVELAPCALTQAVWERKWAQLRKEGYLRYDGLLPEEEASRLAEVVLRVEQRTGLPLFGMVYDAFWALIPRMAGLLARILGEEFRVLPHCWMWVLRPNGEDSGWGVHRDCDDHTLGSDGAPHTLTLWVALTDATPDNGCIYALPAAYDPEYHEARSSAQLSLKALQSIRAIPAAAGSALMWTQHLMHWGGRCGEFASGPRISLAFELQRADVPAYGIPLLPMDTIPSFSMRLQLIARQLLQYRHMTDVPDGMVALAKKLLRALASCT